MLSSVLWCLPVLPEDGWVLGRRLVAMPSIQFVPHAGLVRGSILVVTSYGGTPATPTYLSPATFCLAARWLYCPFRRFRYACALVLFCCISGGSRNAARKTPARLAAFRTSAVSHSLSIQPLILPSLPACCLLSVYVLPALWFATRNVTIYLDGVHALDLYSVLEHRL
jgi:hypothetical protein